MYVYKYCSPSVLNFGMLSRGELFFASAGELNDGSECRPRYILKGSSELWSRLADMILLDACCFSEGVLTCNIGRIRSLGETLGCILKAKAGKRDLDFEQLWPLVRTELPGLLARIELGISPEAFMGFVREACAHARRHLKEPKYMTSFSRNPCDPTMWGHYGNAERGFIIVFDAPEQKLRISSPLKVFPGSRPEGPDGIHLLGNFSTAEIELQPVLYRSAPQRFNAFHRLIPHFSYSEAEDHYDVPLLLPGDAPARKEEQFGLVKATTWKYEQEMRAFHPSFESLTAEARCANYDWTQVAGLIFGPKMSRADKERTIVCCHILHEARRDKEPRVTPFAFFEAQQQVNTFQMGLTAVGVLSDLYTEQFLPYCSIQQADDATQSKVQDLLAQLHKS